MKNIIIIGIVLLFIGNIVSPVFSADIDILSDSNDVVEFTVETCGFDKNDKHSVNLSLEDAEKLKILFDEIQDKLSNIKSREEAEVIFENAVTKLDDLGFLGDLSFDKAVEFVTRKYLDSRIYSVFEKDINDFDMNSKRNNLCLISGVTKNSWFSGLFSRAFFLMVLMLITFASLSLLMFTNIVMAFLETLILYSFEMTFFSNFNIMPICNSIGFGYDYYPLWDDYSYEIPAHGWIWTLGLNGIKKWNGSFYGKLFRVGMFKFDQTFRIGVVGFTGIHIRNKATEKDYFLGSALKVRLSPDRWWYYN